MKKRTTMIALLLGLCVGPLVAADADPADVEFPQGYRDWKHVKSMVINPGHPLYEAVGGIHSIYGNPEAVAGYQSGKKFPDGSVIVFDLFQAVDQDNAIAEGERKAVIVMEKRGGKFTTTDGWGYQVFDASGNATLDAKAATECHACHTQMKQEDFVFSAWRD